MAEQKMRFTDSELATIKAVFADREDLLKILRKVFQFATLDDKDQALIKESFSSKPVRDVLAKSFLPQIDLDAPINQIVDLWMTVDIKDKDFGQALVTLRARELLIDLLKQGLARFDDMTAIFKPLSNFGLSKFDDLVEKDIANLIARNTLISHIEQQLYQLKLLAGQKEETVEETKERLTKNSSK